jgi:hypothetical protein
MSEDWGTAEDFVHMAAELRGQKLRSKQEAKRERVEALHHRADSSASRRPLDEGAAIAPTDSPPRGARGIHPEMERRPSGGWSRAGGDLSTQIPRIGTASRDEPLPGGRPLFRDRTRNRPPISHNEPQGGMSGR